VCVVEGKGGGGPRLSAEMGSAFSNSEFEMKEGRLPQNKKNKIGGGISGIFKGLLEGLLYSWVVYCQNYGYKPLM
jgi:hypothetical protein